MDCALGAAVSFSEGGALLFSGYIIERTKSTADSVIDIICFDRGFHLKRNKISRTITNQPAESAVAAIAAEFGISCGELAATGIPLSRNFLGGYSIYDVFATLYSMAAEQNGKKYLISFAGAKLCVREIGVGMMVYIEGGSNLMDATTTESNSNTVNTVLVLDKNGNALFSKSDAESVASYGTLQQTVKQTDDVDINAVVAEMLKKAVPEQKITVTCLGNVNCVTGAAVMLREPITGLYGKFYIDSDTHIWRNGIYTCKLVLTLQAVMDAKSAGAAVSSGVAAGSYTAALEQLEKAAAGVH